MDAPFVPQTVNIWKTPVILTISLANVEDQIKVHHRPGDHQVYTYFSVADGAQLEYVADYYDGEEYWIFGTITGTSLQGWMLYDYATFNQ